MTINFMTWNTGLFIFGNKLKYNPIIPIDETAVKTANEIFGIIKNFLEKENAVVALQEIPYKSNLDWLKHPFFTKFVKTFPEESYCCIYNKIKGDRAIKMTVVLAKKGLIRRIKIEENNNIYVPFQIAPDTPSQLTALAVHSHGAKECLEYLQEHGDIDFSLILGDFNSGNYIKETNDASMAENREQYLKLINGYIDICQGEFTRSNHTYIDHVLLRSKYSFLQTHKVSNLDINRTVNYSDHYPITFELELL